MARPSEGLTWKLLGGPRPCSECGRKLTIPQVREHGVRYPGRVEYVVCVDCWEARHGRPEAAAARP